LTRVLADCTARTGSLAVLSFSQMAVKAKLQEKLQARVEASVSELVALTGLDRPDARALLEATGGNVSMAAELHFGVGAPAVRQELLESAVGQMFGSECPSLRNIAELSDRMRDDRLARTLKGDFCWSLNYDPALFSALLYEGFLLICRELRNGNEPLYVLSPKLHVDRCILDWPDRHVSQKAHKVSKKYELTISTAFDDVLQGIISQHGENWLFPPMRKSYTAISGIPRAGHEPKVPLAISFELWRRATPEAPRRLVAGEFGTIVGRSYLSLSAFRTEDNSGSVQLYLTCEVLRLAGFEYWDLGQGPPHEYKFKMGGKLVPRSAFLERFRKIRDSPNSLAALLEKFGNVFTRDGLKVEEAARAAAAAGVVATTGASSSTSSAATVEEPEDVPEASRGG
jgi:Leu/Phe-tRNA-protein transferase